VGHVAILGISVGRLCVMTKKKSGTEEVQLSEPVLPEVDTPVQQATLLPTALKFTWTDAEAETIQTIKRAVDQIVMREHKEAFFAVHHLLAKVRQQQVGNDGALLFDEGGKPMWMRNLDGSVLEDYSRLDAIDIDGAIMKFASYAFFAGQSSIDNYMEAVFAKYAADDAYQDMYSSIMTGTVPDKTATAERKSREERYFAFFKAYSHKRIKELIDRMDALRRALEFVRQAQQKDREREWRANTR
jgi:hypothetical protein